MSKINYQTLLDENARLRAERDALREGEMGNATHGNTRAAADIYFQLVEECQIPPGGSLVQYVFDLQEKAQGVPKERRELVMWIKRLAHSLSRAKPESKLPDEAKEYLERKGLVSVEDALR